MTNVIFIPYQEKDTLIYSLNAGDVHWCINAKGIKGVSCPSKFYGIAAVNKPIIGVLEKGSEIRLLIEETDCGICCEPGDYMEIERIIRKMINKVPVINCRSFVEQNLTKEKSIEKYIKVISEL